MPVITISPNRTDVVRLIDELQTIGVTTHYVDIGVARRQDIIIQTPQVLEEFSQQEINQIEREKWLASIRRKQNRSKY